MRYTFAAIAVILAFGLCGCTVPAYGLLGFTKNAAGTVEAVIQMCEGHHVDGLTVYVYGDSDVEGPDVVKVATEEPITDFSTIDIGHDFESKLAELGEVRGYAWSNDSSSSANGPYFSEENISALLPRQILSESTDPNAGGSSLYSLDGFVEAAAQYCD